jgi:hypothetical protein
MQLPFQPLDALETNILSEKGALEVLPEIALLE